MKDCTLVSESPAGQGFGLAALAMAAKSPDNPDLDVTEAALLAAQPITVRFSFSPPQIDPDLTQMAHVVKRPRVVQSPSPLRVSLYYPIEAKVEKVGGSATVRCHVTPEGELVGCTVVREAPKGRRFGDAAIRAAEREYRMSPLTVDGKPTGQGEADLTIAFEATPAPAADAQSEAAEAADIRKPLWIRKPDGQSVADAYPEAAQRHGISGAAIVRCVVDAKGDLDPCTLVGEAPAGHDFGRAALEITKSFQMQAKDGDGVPTAGRSITIPVQFWVPH